MRAYTEGDLLPFLSLPPEDPRREVCEKYLSLLHGVRQRFVCKETGLILTVESSVGLDVRIGEGKGVEIQIGPFSATSRAASRLKAAADEGGGALLEMTRAAMARRGWPVHMVSFLYGPELSKGVRECISTV